VHWSGCDDPEVLEAERIGIRASDVSITGKVQALTEAGRKMAGIDIG